MIEEVFERNEGMRKRLHDVARLMARHAGEGIIGQSATTCVDYNSRRDHRARTDNDAKMLGEGFAKLPMFVRPY